MAVLAFGSKRFRLRVHEDLSVIEVTVEGRKPRVVLNRLMEHALAIIGECMKSLLCFPAVIYSCGDRGRAQKGLILDDETFLIPLAQIVSVVESHSVLNRPGGRRLLSEAEAKAAFSDWIGVKETVSQFDLFLSYRWGVADSAFVRCVYDRFSLYTVGAANRDVHVFLDTECLSGGKYDNYITVE